MVYISSSVYSSGSLLDILVSVSTLVFSDGRGFGSRYLIPVPHIGLISGHLRHPDVGDVDFSLWLNLRSAMCVPPGFGPSDVPPVFLLLLASFPTLNSHGYGAFGFFSFGKGGMDHTLYTNCFFFAPFSFGLSLYIRCSARYHISFYRSLPRLITSRLLEGKMELVV